MEPGPLEKRRWTEALEKWGPRRVQAELSERALGSSACINVGGLEMSLSASFATG